MCFEVEVQKLLNLVDPPVLIFKAQVIFAAAKQQHVLGFKFQAIRFGIEQAIDMHKAILNQNLLHVRSHLEWLAQVADQLGITGVRDLDGVHPTVGCLQLDHPFAVEDFGIGNLSDVARNQVRKGKVELIL